MIPSRTVRRVLTLLLLTAGGAAAQERDAWVQPPGVARLTGGGTFSRYDALLADGPMASVPPGLLEPLTSARFAPLAAPEAELAAFLQATEGTEGAAPASVGPETFLLGRVAGGGRVGQREIPIGVRLGVLPRVEVGVTVPVVRGELLVPEAPLRDGTVGLNPSPEGNAEQLATIDPRWEALGRARYLPVDSSALGRELQRRVVALTGAEIALPDSTLRPAELQASLDAGFGLAPFASRNSPWQVGDVEVDARLRLLSTFGADAYPRDAGRTHLRVALTLGARLPTGSEPDTVRLLDPLPEVGLAGGRAGVAADLFAGRWFWMSAGAEVAAFAEVEVQRRLAAPDAPLATDAPVRTVRWSPGTRLAGWVAPRVRLTDEVALGADYLLRVAGASTFEVAGGDGDAALLDPLEHRAHALGVSARYSTLPAYAERRASLAVEAEIGYRRVLAGSGGAPEASAVTATLSLFHPLWGGAADE